MPKRQFTKEQVMNAVHEHEAGVAAEVICRRHAISERTFGRWQAKYAGVGTPLLERLRTLEAENRHLKRRLAEAMTRPMWPGRSGSSVA